MKNQQIKLHKLILERGKDGLNSWDATYLHGIKQAPTRYSELKEDWGCTFYPPRKHKNRSVDWIHLACKDGSNKATEPKQVPCTVDSCTIENHYKPYVKDNRKFYKHETPEEPKQEQLSV